MKFAADTSAVVAAFASWHEHHDVARAAFEREPGLVAHCALETYSVLTRMPAPHRAPAELVSQFLQQQFPRPFLRLPAAAYRRFILGLVDKGITGGASYDALVAATAAHADAELISCDRRAVSTYERYGVRVRLLG
mgnify:CR=1 FL=1